MALLENLTIGAPRGDPDLEKLAPLAGQAFDFPPEKAFAYFDLAGRENFRLARHGEKVAAGLALLPMGQFWGGRSVPMTGVALVCVAPQYRSQGVGVQLMAAAMRELYEKEVPLSTLYPATQPLYRKVGFEVAGSVCECRVPTDFIDLREKGAEVRPIGAEDEKTVRELYRAWAVENPGNLDRSDFIWKRVEEFRGTVRRGYLIERDGQAEGYFYYAQKMADGRRLLEVSDCVMATPAAGRRFWQFMADHRSMAEKVWWFGPPHDPLLLILREQSREITAKTYWMMRIVRVAEALMQRGYPAGLTGEVHLRIADEILPENAGDYVLRVRDGRGEVERGGKGSLEMDVRGLAALYTGSLSAAQLAALGWLKGDAASQRMATAMFAGPMPWMRDGF